MAHIFPFLCAVARPTHPQGAYFVFPDLSAFGGSDGSLVAAPDEQLDSWLSLGGSENGASPKLRQCQSGQLMINQNQSS